VKMCLATRISRSKESADFSNGIGVVAVGDIVTSVLTESHPLAVPVPYRTPLRRFVVGAMHTSSDGLKMSQKRVPHLNFGWPTVENTRATRTQREDVPMLFQIHKPRGSRDLWQPSNKKKKIFACCPSSSSV
jgi:hypothetical protein